MLFELCRQSFERFKKQQPDWAQILKDDHSYLLAEYRPDWDVLLEGLPAECYRYNLISELDDFFIAVCLFLGEKKTDEHSKTAALPMIINGRGSGKTVLSIDPTAYLQS